MAKLSNRTDDVNSSQRLERALAEMAADGTALTASALCERARISRNALYRYHADVVHELYKLQRKVRRKPSPTESTLQRLRDDNAALHLQIAQLAALVDHYFAAWREAAAPIKRGKLESGDLRKIGKSNVVPIRKGP